VPRCAKIAEAGHSQVFHCKRRLAETPSLAVQMALDCSTESAYWGNNELRRRPEQDT
jgi:hypothetical protein